MIRHALHDATAPAARTRHVSALRVAKLAIAWRGPRSDGVDRCVTRVRLLRSEFRELQQDRRQHGRRHRPASLFFHSAAVMLLGAEVNAVLARERGDALEEAES
jgi:hypothetical protein